VTHQPDREDYQPPADVQEVDRLLRQVRFQPRNSLEPELLRRVSRGEPPQLKPGPSRFRRLAPIALALGIAAALGLWSITPEKPMVIDRCCYDLDGGGLADDGALIIADRNGRVHRLSVYEDRDASGTLTLADTVRLERTGAPIPEEFLAAGLTRIRHCCQDFDGGGPPDDELLVIATPPDRVHTAAIYELR
jgi:hypothetical protein